MLQLENDVAAGEPLQCKPKTEKTASRVCSEAAAVACWLKKKQMQSAAEKEKAVRTKIVM